MDFLRKCNLLSNHLLILAGALAIASAVVNVVTALTMVAVDKLEEPNQDA